MTRKEAENLLTNISAFDIDNKRGIDKQEALEMAIEALEQTQWIPVSERLPEIHNYSDNYLVTLKRGGIYIAMFIESDGKYWWTYDDVEAWMPLPEPYKESEENDDIENMLERLWNDTADEESEVEK